VRTCDTDWNEIASDEAGSPKMHTLRTIILALAEFNFLELQGLTLRADNSFCTAFSLTDGLFEILTLFDSDNQTTLLHAAVKPTNEVLG
jgi:hypothetical protein